MWGGKHPPPKRCRDCGAQGKENYGPIIDMVPRPGYYSQPHWYHSPTTTYFRDLVAFNTTGTTTDQAVTYDQVAAQLGQGLKRG